MRRKLPFLLMLSFFAMTAYAQLPVSTAPENKNVVLEEYTGIYCQYCPDGHRRANELAAANPGDVVLINIHAGGYAQPSGGDPDYRTSWGGVLAAQTKLVGYPAGTINRHEFPGMSQGSSGTAMSRGDWAAAASQILQQASYVNVALQGDLDTVANTLTIDVEMYFTGNSAPASVKLNVAILQDNIEGPQIDGGNFNPDQRLPNGNYNHQHMLRDLVTGAWGEEINTTTEGSLVQKQYVYNVPADINGVPVVPEDLEIAAFVAESKQEIITGSVGPVYNGDIGIRENKAHMIHDVQVFPNPAKTFVAVELELDRRSQVDFSLKDVSGRTVLSLPEQSMPAGLHQEVIDLDGLASGVYLLNFAVDGKSSVKKIYVVE